MSNAVIRNLKVLGLLSNTSRDCPLTVEAIRKCLAEEDLHVSSRQLQRDLIALSRWFAINNDVGEHREHLWFSCGGNEMRAFRRN